MAPQAVKQGGLRELKRKRTHETILRVAFELFGSQGYQATTLAQIAAAAEISPSTLHAYFRTKEDIVFHDDPLLRDSLRAYVVERPAGQTVAQAMLQWVGIALPERLSGEGGRHAIQRSSLVEANADLFAVERLHLALLEDVIAEAFSSEFGEQPTDLRSRLMASVTTNGLKAIWDWWFTDQHHDTDELTQIDATYLVGLIEAAQAALETLPNPLMHSNPALR